jgi:nickel-type superoxide dismutase maturation protease
MLPAYKPGDHLLVERVTFWLRSPRPGDVVVLRDPEVRERYLVKRVAERTRVRGERARYVVLGDNPDASRDSRTFGPVPRTAIIGRAWFRY